MTTPQSYSTGIGVQGSSDGYRQDKVHVFFKIKDLVGPESDLESYEDLASKGNYCLTGKSANASLFVESDLKLSDWLRAVTNLQHRQQSNFQLPDSFGGNSGVISHEVKFEIVSSGNASAMWKLEPISANTGSSPLFAASRDRTQDLILTLGPQSNGNLKPAGQNSANAAEIAAAIRNAFTGLSVTVAPY